MVKNELSIKAQQSYEVELKIADQKIKLIKDGIASSISSYKAKVSFKTSKQEAKLFETRINHLNENVEALFNKNPLDAKVVLLKNNKEMQRINWSFVKIDRNNPNKEMVKKQIALNRHSTVIYDINYDEAVFDAKWSNFKLEKEIKDKLEIDRLTQEIYKDNAHLEEVSYNDFYNGVVKSHKELTSSMQNDLKEFYPVILDTINYCNEITYAKDVREDILSSIRKIASLYESLEKNDVDNVYKNIDRQLIEIQEKEGLDVKNEKEEILKQIEFFKSEKVRINEEISNESKHLDELLQLRIDRKLQDFELNTTITDEAKLSVLNRIKEAFKQPSNEVFGTIYRIIKDYVTSSCPFFYDYLKQEEEKYEKHNKEYRLEKSKELESNVAKLYLSNKEKYLKHICSNENNNEIIAKLNEEHANNIKAINEQYLADKKDLVNQKANRKKEYLAQKANSKIILKNADGAKSAEIRDVLKLYKKEINSGEIKRYRNIRKKKLASLKLEKQRYESSMIKETNPLPIAYKFDCKLRDKKDKVTQNKERKDLNRINNKDFSSSKYRKNLNTSKRENGLGYLFLSVWAIGFVLLALIPIIYTILMFFSNVTYDNAGYSPVIEFTFRHGFKFPNWVGFDNFETLILQDVYFSFTMIPRFFRSLLFYVPIVVFVGFVLAMLLNSKIKGRTFFRVIYFLPVVIVSGPVLAMLNNQNSSGQSSIRLTLDGSSIAKILASISPKALQYANEVFNNFIIILWMTGVPIVLFISALQKINRQLYEAAEIDGANKWQMLWTITYPLIKSVLLIVCLFTIMQVTTINVSFVNPINSWIDSKLATTNYNIGMVAVGCWIQTFIVLIFVLVAFLLFREKEFVSKDKNFEEIEEAKRKKNQRKAKMVQMFKVNEIKHFFSKLFAPITRAINSMKAKKKAKGA